MGFKPSLLSLVRAFWFVVSRVLFFLFFFFFRSPVVLAWVSLAFTVWFWTSMKNAALTTICLRFASKTKAEKKTVHSSDESVIYPIQTHASHAHTDQVIYAGTGESYQIPVGGCGAHQRAKLLIRFWRKFRFFSPSHTAIISFRVHTIDSRSHHFYRRSSSVVYVHIFTCLSNGMALHRSTIVDVHTQFIFISKVERESDGNSIPNSEQRTSSSHIHLHTTQHMASISDSANHKTLY